MKRFIAILAVISIFCALAAGCGGLGKKETAPAPESIAAPGKAADSTAAAKSGNAAETAKTEKSGGAEKIKYDPYGRVSWFPLDVLIPNTWPDVSARAEAYGLKAYDSSNQVGLPTKTVRSPKDPVNAAVNKKNSMTLMLVEEDGPLAMVSGTDMDFDWDRIDAYPEENPCIRRLSISYHDGVPEIAAVEIQLDNTADPVVFLLENRKEYGTEFIFGHLQAMHDAYPDQTPEFHAYTFEERVGEFRQGQTINGLYEIKTIK